MSENKKHNEYALKILEKLSELVDEDNDDCLDLEELKEGDNMTDFSYALLCVAPSFLLQKLTGREDNILQSNHIANQLIYQYKEK